MILKQIVSAQWLASQVLAEGGECGGETHVRGMATFVFLWAPFFCSRCVKVPK